MNGTRVEDVGGEQLVNRLAEIPGSYGKKDDGIWFAVTPTGLMCCLAKHSVTEHEDGTISVTPPILVTGASSWHGYLERGVWREC